MKTLAIFGSTGSIGTTSLKVLKKNKKKFKLLYLSANTNYKKLKIQASKFSPERILLTNQELNKKKNLYDKSIILERDLFKKKTKIDFVVSGISGYDAMNFNFKLLKISKNLLIANKETIICGGKVFLNQAKKKKCNLIPIDSEHHCIDYFVKNFNLKKNIKKIYITASGGPFLKKKFKYKENLKDVLLHPTWKMGKKITVNSSTFANKVAELFEAKILFNLKRNQIDFKIDETSKVHAVFELKNNMSFFVSHNPSMELSISNGLNVSNNIITNFSDFNFKLINPDLVKFPIIKIGYRILNELSESGMIFFIVFNERLVDLYLNNKINYGDIGKILVKLFSKKNILYKSKTVMKTKAQILKTINFAKSFKIC